MDEIQVDPKLFVTCRLCLEDLGKYQIVPSVQQQIRYCFDIEVEPFDGLPQLICIKCKEILNKFHTVKTTFCEKQTDLRNKVIKKDEIFSMQTKQETVSSSQQAPEAQPPTKEIIYDPCISKNIKSRKKRLLPRSSSSSDLESEQSFQTSNSQKKKSSKSSESSMPWKAGYKKSLACKLCNSYWSNKRSLSNHIHSHDILQERYKNILSRECTVNLIKMDDEPNITGSSNMVVHSSRKIVESSNSYFYTIYSKENVQNEDEYKWYTKMPSEDEEEIVIKPTKPKRRLISRSSNETVVIESNSNKLMSDEEDSKIIDGPSNNYQCVNIISSDSESDRESGTLEKSGKVKQPMAAKGRQFKIVHGILSMCINSYIKKTETTAVDMVYINVNKNTSKSNAQISNESQLKHKVLSIGRKIINKQGFNCTGLLRFMEQKCLELLWMPKSQLLHPKDTNYIRILPKLRVSLNLEEDNGWTKSSDLPQAISFNSIPNNNSVNIGAPNKSLSNVPVSNDSAAAKIPISMKQPPFNANIERSQQEKIDTQPKLKPKPAILYLDSKASTSDPKKLLNANPVANPKQLPKKLVPANESRSNNKAVRCQQSKYQPSKDENNYHLPIITSTTSLATIKSEEQPKDTIQTDCVSSEEINKAETPAPRIKVKPASELMSEKALDIMKGQSTTVTDSNMLISQTENVWPRTFPTNVFVPNNAPKLQLIPASPQPLKALHLPTLDVNTAIQPMPAPLSSHTKSEYVILDTTDLPNTKTNSPLKYVKDLLHLHNIFLVDHNEELSKKFKCLIRFKVVFKQDRKIGPPVGLCLSLSCYKNNICFQIRDNNQLLIDFKNVSTNWQWEILQTYRGDVCNRILQNAQKFGQDMYDVANNLCCLLKTINCRKPG